MPHSLLPTEEIRSIASPDMTATDTKPAAEFAPPVIRGGFFELSTTRAQIDELHGLFQLLLVHSCGWIGKFNDSTAFNLMGGMVGTVGMPLFFVLSGFVIHYNYGKIFASMQPKWEMAG